MGLFRAVASALLAVALVAGAVAHGSRAAAMALPMAMAWSADSAQPCGLCAGQDQAQAAAHCALTCAGMTGIVSGHAEVREPVPHQPVAATPIPIAGRAADPEPHPPR